MHEMLDKPLQLRSTTLKNLGAVMVSATSITLLLWEFPSLVVSNLVVCHAYAEALFCALALALVCAHLRSFARNCVFLHPTTFRATVFGNFGLQKNEGAGCNLFVASLVAFQTQTQNRRVLATQFPKSHPCPLC